MSKRRQNVLLGLTGSIGAGKSTVAQWLRSQGVTVFDADEVAREVMASPELLTLLAQNFAGVVQGGQLDRAALAKQVFGDEAQRLRLNALVHPLVRQRMQELTQQAWRAGQQVVVQDIPLLYENGLEQHMDGVLVVDAPRSVRVQRVMARSGLSEVEVLARDARQYPSEQKRQRATWLFDNSSSPEALQHQLRQRWPSILAQVQDT